MVRLKFSMENSSKSVQGVRKRRETENKPKRETKRGQEQKARGQAENKSNKERASKSTRKAKTRERIERMVVGIVAGE